MGIGASGFRVTPVLGAADMIQNTVVEIVSALIRDCRMYWARACMTD